MTTVVVLIEAWPQKRRLSPSDCLEHSGLSSLLCNGKVSLSQQEQCIGSTLIQCWASVVDGGPILGQHRANVGYILYIIT